MTIHHRIWSGVCWVVSHLAFLMIFLSSIIVSGLLAACPFILWNNGVPSEAEMELITGKIIWSFGAIGTLVYLFIAILAINSVIRYIVSKVSELVKGN